MIQTVGPLSHLRWSLGSTKVIHHLHAIRTHTSSSHITRARLRTPFLNLSQAHDDLIPIPLTDQYTPVPQIPKEVTTGWPHKRTPCTPAVPHASTHDFPPLAFSPPRHGSASVIFLECSERLQWWRLLPASTTNLINGPPPLFKTIHQQWHRHRAALSVVVCYPPGVPLGPAGSWSVRKHGVAQVATSSSVHIPDATGLCCSNWRQQHHLQVLCWERDHGIWQGARPSCFESGVFWGRVFPVGFIWLWLGQTRTLLGGWGASSHWCSEGQLGSILHWHFQADGSSGSWPSQVPKFTKLKPFITKLLSFLSLTFNGLCCSLGGFEIR